MDTESVVTGHDCISDFVVCKISIYAKIFDLTGAISGTLQAASLKAVSLTTIRCPIIG
jgi:hypothetical protein